MHHDALHFPRAPPLHVLDGGGTGPEGQSWERSGAQGESWGLLARVSQWLFPQVIYTQHEGCLFEGTVVGDPGTKWVGVAMATQYTGICT